MTSKSEKSEKRSSSKRQTTFRFTLEPTPSQVEALSRHVGASRFAFNQGLRFVKAAMDASIAVPWSGFDLINTFNRWKLTADAGVTEDGVEGLSWRSEVCQQVFEEAVVDLGRALSAFSAGRRGERKGKPPRFPKFKKRTTSRASFRLRNKTNDIRVGTSASPRSIRLPKLGVLAVRECTRDLRRMLRNGRAKIWFATISRRTGGRWQKSRGRTVSSSPARAHTRRNIIERWFGRLKIFRRLATR